VTRWAEYGEQTCDAPCEMGDFRGNMIHHCEKPLYHNGDHAERLDACSPPAVLSWPDRTEVGRPLTSYD
jgi:hypothetical protein